MPSGVYFVENTRVIKKHEIFVYIRCLTIMELLLAQRGSGLAPKEKHSEEIFATNGLTESKSPSRDHELVLLILVNRPPCAVGFRELKITDVFQLRINHRARCSLVDDDARQGNRKSDIECRRRLDALCENTKSDRPRISSQQTAQRRQYTG